MALYFPYPQRAFISTTTLHRHFIPPPPLPLTGNLFHHYPSPTGYLFHIHSPSHGPFIPPAHLSSWAFITPPPLPPLAYYFFASPTPMGSISSTTYLPPKGILFYHHTPPRPFYFGITPPSMVNLFNHHLYPHWRFIPPPTLPQGLGLLFYNYPSPTDILFCHHALPMGSLFPHHHYQRPFYSMITPPPWAFYSTSTTPPHGHFNPRPVPLPMGSLFRHHHP